MDEKVIIDCPNCSQRLSLPAGLGVLAVTCPSCRFKWEWPTNTATSTAASSGYADSDLNVHAGGLVEVSGTALLDDRIRRFVSAPPNRPTGRFLTPPMNDLDRRLNEIAAVPPGDVFVDDNENIVRNQVSHLREKGYYVVVMYSYDAQRGKITCILGLARNITDAEEIKARQHLDPWEENEASAILGKDTTIFIYGPLPSVQGQHAQQTQLQKPEPFSVMVSCPQCAERCNVQVEYGVHLLVRCPMCRHQWKWPPEPSTDTAGTLSTYVLRPSRWVNAALTGMPYIVAYSEADAVERHNRDCKYEPHRERADGATKLDHLGWMVRLPDGREGEVVTIWWETEVVPGQYGYHEQPHCFEFLMALVRVGETLESQPNDKLIYLVKNQEEECIRQHQEYTRQQQEDESKRCEAANRAHEQEDKRREQERAQWKQRETEWQRTELERVKRGEIVTNNLGMKFAWVSPGTYVMGSSAQEKGRRTNETQHTVTLTKGFYLGTMPVTQRQWQQLMGEKAPKAYSDFVWGFSCDDPLVSAASWNDCQRFIARLRGREQKPYRLPTEAEWEYSLRAGTTTPFYYTAMISAEQMERQSLWNSHGVAFPQIENYSLWQKHCVLPPNDWGLHGSPKILEWCQDWLGSYSQPYVVDPQGPVDGEYRVQRGGRSAAREGHLPDFACSGFGFRVCYQPE